MPEIPAELARTADILDGMIPAERTAALVRFAADFEEVPPTVAERPFPEANRVPGCESDIYVWAVDRPDGTLKFHFAVGNPQGISARAMAVILDRTLSGQPVDEVASVRPDIASRLFGGWQAMGGAGAGVPGMMAMAAGAAARRLDRN